MRTLTAIFHLIGHMPNPFRVFCSTHFSTVRKRARLGTSRHISADFACGVFLGDGLHLWYPLVRRDSVLESERRTVCRISWAGTGVTMSSLALGARSGQADRPLQHCRSVSSMACRASWPG